MLVFTYAIAFHLTIINHKFHAFHYCEHFLLGLKYPINRGNSTSLALMKQKLIVSFRKRSHLHQESICANCNSVISKCLKNRGACVGVLLTWSLQDREDLDGIFAAEIRRRFKNLCFSQTENLYQSALVGTANNIALSATTAKCARPGFWVSTRISFGWKCIACLTKQRWFPASHAYPTLHQSLLGAPFRNTLKLFPRLVPSNHFSRRTGT